MYDKNISPVGWYVCLYLLRFVELRWPHKDDPDARFVSWENTVLVKAGSVEEAYDKTVAIAKKASQPYNGGVEAVDVQWVLVGVSEVLPVYEELEDGAEIMWSERAPRKLKNLRALVRDKHTFAQ